MLVTQPPWASPLLQHSFRPLAGSLSRLISSRVACRACSPVASAPPALGLLGQPEELAPQGAAAAAVGHLARVPRQGLLVQPPDDVRAQLLWERQAGRRLSVAVCCMAVVGGPLPALQHATGWGHAAAVHRANTNSSHKPTLQALDS